MSVANLKRITCDGIDCENYEPVFPGETVNNARKRLSLQEHWACFRKRRDWFDICRTCLDNGNEAA
jgi:hypothetical protein